MIEKMSFAEALVWGATYACMSSTGMRGAEHDADMSVESLRVRQAEGDPPVDLVDEVRRWWRVLEPIVERASGLWWNPGLPSAADVRALLRLHPVRDEMGQITTLWLVRFQPLDEPHLVRLLDRDGQLLAVLGRDGLAAGLQPIGSQELDLRAGQFAPLDARGMRVPWRAIRRPSEHQAGYVCQALLGDLDEHTAKLLMPRMMQAYAQGAQAEGDAKRYQVPHLWLEVPGSPGERCCDRCGRTASLEEVSALREHCGELTALDLVGEWACARYDRVMLQNARLALREIKYGGASVGVLDELTRARIDAVLEGGK